MAMDVVDYEIKGAEMQFVEVELDPGEAAIGEAGSMMFMEAGVEMDTVFGDGSAQQGGGLFGFKQGWQNHWRASGERGQGADPPVRQELACRDRRRFHL